MLNRAEWITTVVLATVFFIPTFFILQNNDKGSRRSNYHYGRMGIIKQIGLGLLMYSGDNAGAFPPDLWTLDDQQVLDASMLAAPADMPDFEPNDPQGVAGRYFYFGKTLRDDDTEATTKALLVYPFLRGARYCVSVLFIDGHVACYYPNDDAELLAMTLPGFDWRRKRP